MIMHEFLENYFPRKLKNVQYADNNEYLRDELLRVRLCVENFFEYFSNENAESRDINFYNSNKERFNVDKEIALDFSVCAKNHVNSRIKKTSLKTFISSRYIKKIYELSSLQWFCILVGINKKLNAFNKKIFESDKFGYNYETILKVFYFEDNIINIPNFHRLLSKLTKKMEDFFFNSDFEIDENIYDFILTNGKNNVNVNGVEIFYPADDKNFYLDIREKNSQKLGKFLINNPSEKSYFYIYSAKGEGKKSIVKRAAQVSKNCLVMLNVGKNIIENYNEFEKILISSLRESYLLNAIFCISNFEILMQPEHENQTKTILNLVKKYSNKIFVLANVEDYGLNKIKKNHQFLKYDENLEFYNYEIPSLTKNESIELWKKFLKKLNKTGSLDLNKMACEMANKFRFTILQIKNTIKTFENLIKWEPSIKITEKIFCDCAYSQITSDFSDKAKQIECQKNWDELILNDSEKIMLKDACSQIKFRHIVYDKWNFSQKVLYGNGLSMLFSGPPGTGKTMAARIVANDLGLKLYKVNLSAIISKYIGETEKNLDEIFELARRGNVILFFDETDAIFGKRTEIKDSHDKNANVEVSYLLQKMEEFDGITIMTTNFQKNIDSAFFRRINYIIHFTLPNAEFRKKIWKGIFPKELPIAPNVDFDFLASNFSLSGGSIKNIALVAAFMAAQEGCERLEFIHILNAIKYELKKQGSTVLNDEFGKYSYLLP